MAWVWRYKSSDNEDSLDWLPKKYQGIADHGFGIADMGGTFIASLLFAVLSGRICFGYPDGAAKFLQDIKHFKYIAKHVLPNFWFQLPFAASAWGANMRSFGGIHRRGVQGITAWRGDTVQAFTGTTPHCTALQGFFIWLLSSLNVGLIVVGLYNFIFLWEAFNATIDDAMPYWLSLTLGIFVYVSMILMAFGSYLPGKQAVQTRIMGTQKPASEHYDYQRPLINLPILRTLFPCKVSAVKYDFWMGQFVCVVGSTPNMCQVLIVNKGTITGGVILLMSAAMYASASLEIVGVLDRYQVARQSKLTSDSTPAPLKSAARSTSSVWCCCVNVDDEERDPLAEWNVDSYTK